MHSKAVGPHLQGVDLGVGTRRVGILEEVVDSNLVGGMGTQPERVGNPADKA